MTTKTCKSCGVEKHTSDFRKNRLACKKCVYADRKQYYNDYNKSNKLTRAQYYKDYNKKHVDRIKIKKKERLARPGEREKMISYLRKYYGDNKEALLKQQAHYHIHRKRTDSKYNLMCRLRLRVYHWIQAKGGQKMMTTRSLIGKDYKDLEEHLNNNDRGLKVGDPGVHVDHIIPLKAFANNGMLDTEFGQKCAFNWRNLQLLPASENVSKGASYDQAEFERYVEMFKSL